MLAACGGGGGSSTDEPRSGAAPATDVVTAPVVDPVSVAPATGTTGGAVADPVVGAGPDVAASPGTGTVTTDANAAQNEQATNLTLPGLRWRGLSLSGAEYNMSSLPGRYGYEYFYPSTTSLDYFQAKGMNLVRLPFVWERLQPVLNGPLDQTELQRLKTFVNAATAKGITVLLDPHNYGRYRREIIGSPNVPHESFGDFWSRLSGVFKANPQVLFGLMNEPYGMTTENWVTAANVAIRRIRAAGAPNTIAVPGNAWSGAYSWEANFYGTPNAQALLKIVDPRNNYVFEVHQYLDADSSGTSSVCVSPTIGAQRLTVFTNWLRANGKRGLLGEFAAANNEVCNQALSGMLSYMEANNDVWVGWSYWLAGAWSSNDFFSIQPVNGADRPQMQLLQPYLVK